MIDLCNEFIGRIEDFVIFSFYKEGKLFICRFLCKGFYVSFIDLRFEYD